MKHKARYSLRLLSVAASAIIFAGALPGFQAGEFAKTHAHGLAAQATSPQHSLKPETDRARGFVTHKTDGETRCREATGAETAKMKLRRAGENMRVITNAERKPALSAEAVGLKITLRGTAQLENFPTAKAAFLNAAAVWESLINTPVSIVIDVDFGPTWFGEPYDADVLGQTDAQVLGDQGIYPDLRNSLASAATVQDGALYSLLPESSVPTNIGSTTYVLAPSAAWRALGFLDAAADPSTEQQSLGDPPAIGFNSDFDYDFDPANGIDSTSLDFDAVAVHEIGHALGFISNTGYNELAPRADVAVSMWDIFRFRPGVTLDTFASASRVLSSGGQQVFFSGSEEIALSTGRPDGTGGDKEQSSHWKDDRLTGRFIGIMDPTLSDGSREEITASDLAALRVMGYQVRSDDAASAPEISNATFNGKKLKLTGKGFNGAIQALINGLALTSSLTVKVNGSGKKLQIKASSSELNLTSGANELVVIGNGAPSNAFILTL